MTAARRILRLASRAAGKSDVGRVREVNEDRLLLLDHAGRAIAVYAVADGLGGHAGGDVASTLAVETLAREIPALLAQGAPPQDALLEAVRRANAAIHGAAHGTERAGMATTCTAVLVNGGEGVVAHVGDSRAYLLRGHDVRQLTTDHSLAGELARLGAPVQAGEHTQRHVLTRALGIARDVEIDCVAESLRAGDVLVLTTDGLHNAVPPEEIGAVVRAAANLEEACGTLVGLANARGGVDNASAIVIRLAPWLGGRAMRLLAPIGLVAFIAGGLAADRLEHAYFLGVREDRIAVMRGVPVSVLGVPLSGVIKVTRVPVSQVAPANRSRLAQGIPTASPEEAERMVPGLLSPP
jgi:protein phosphatase